jgi:hypothetical protein
MAAGSYMRAFSWLALLTHGIVDSEAGGFLSGGQRQMRSEQTEMVVLEQGSRRTGQPRIPGERRNHVF